MHISLLPLFAVVFAASTAAEHIGLEQRGFCPLDQLAATDTTTGTIPASTRTSSCSIFVNTNVSIPVLGTSFIPSSISTSTSGVTTRSSESTSSSALISTSASSLQTSSESTTTTSQVSGTTSSATPSSTMVPLTAAKDGIAMELCILALATIVTQCWFML